MAYLTKTRAETQLRYLIANSPTTVTCGSVELTGRKSTIADTQELVAAGIADAYLFSVMTVKDDWTDGTPTPSETKVTIDGAVYRVLRVYEDELGAQFRIDLGKEYALRGALTPRGA